MSYMLLIVEPMGQRQARSRAEGEQAYQQMMDYAADLDRRGLLLGCNALASTQHAVRLQAPEGKPRLLDGPFAEVKEMVGGYFLLNCETQEQAIEEAGRCPAAAWATVEVRRIGTCYED